MQKGNNLATLIEQEIDAVDLKTDQPAPISSPDALADQKMPPEILRLRVALHQVPETRAKLVERTRAEIEAGTYQINSMLIARKLLGFPDNEMQPE